MRTQHFSFKLVIVTVKKDLFRGLIQTMKALYLSYVLSTIEISQVILNIRSKALMSCINYHIFVHIGHIDKSNVSSAVLNLT